MSNESLIVIKRVEEVIEAKKGGAWKVAHADFMTAMMAFFLIMWLVNATDDEIKKSIANYFNPMNLMSAPTDDRGLDNPTTDTMPPASGKEAGQSAGDRPMGAETPGNGGGAGGGGNVEQGNQNHMDSAGILQQTDAAAFNDPYATHASAAADIAPDKPVSVDVPQSVVGATGSPQSSQSPNDPFDPAQWQTRAPHQATSSEPSFGSSSGPAKTLTSGPAATETEGDPAATPSEQLSAHNGAAPRSAAAAAVMAQFGDDPAEPTAAVSDTAQEMKATAAELAKAIAGASADVTVTAGKDSILISLTDDKNFSMFAIGSSDPTPAAAALFTKVAGVLATRDGNIVVRGHTDARPFASRSSDNWVLSFARAHATKDALVQAGVAEQRIARVEGLADREPSVPADPLADANRRIEILYEPAGETP